MIQSLSIMRSDKGWTIVIIREGQEMPEILHFPGFVGVKEYFATLSA